ncbi:MAG: DegT/DnrJ/EryC1/StrS family aminotransferase [Alphaproteobacteria bacterium]|nr:DegT/DnrJ/EryC1/StrS family aminotransferase [Alphaproteobacteria bacterium]
MIPQTDPKAAYLAQKAEIDAALARALMSGWYILGEEVKGFEREFAAFAGAPRAIGVANGTDALAIGLRALGVRPGDRVITVSHTAVATVAAIEMIGAVPLLVDIEEGGYGMDPEALEAALSLPGAPVRAIVPVHLYGHPAAMDRIMPIATRAGVAVLEDCSQAHGARLLGQGVGSFGQAAAYSLYPTKNLGALGDGGVLTANEATLADHMVALREYGWRERYVSDIAGQNSRLDELQAAILRVKLRALDADNERRRQIAALYRAALDGLAFGLPVERRDARHVYHQFVIRCRRRDQVREFLRGAGVASNVHYPLPVHLQPAYRGRIALAPSGLARTEEAARTVLSLPMFPQLPESDVQRVAAALAGAATSGLD